MTTGRTFRQRKPAQLQPYTTEQSRYARTLLANGWKGALVAGLARGGSLSTDELRRRKEEADKAPRDNLGGWLELESGQKVGRVQEEGESSESGSEASVDGETLLERRASKVNRRERKESRLGKPRKRPRDNRGTDSGCESSWVACLSMPPVADNDPLNLDRSRTPSDRTPTREGPRTNGQGPQPVQRR